MLITNKEWDMFSRIVRQEIARKPDVTIEYDENRNIVAFHYKGKAHRVITNSLLEGMLAEMRRIDESSLATESKILDLFEDIIQRGSKLKETLELTNKVIALNETIQLSLKEKEQMLKGIAEYKNKLVDKPKTDVSTNPIIYTIGKDRYNCGKAGLCYHGVVASYMGMQLGSEPAVIFTWNGKTLGYNKDKHGLIVDEFEGKEIESLMKFDKERSLVDPNRVKTLLSRRLNVDYNKIEFEESLNRFNLEGKDLIEQLLQ